MGKGGEDRAHTPAQARSHDAHDIKTVVVVGTSQVLQKPKPRAADLGPSIMFLSRLQQCFSRICQWPVAPGPPLLSFAPGIYIYRTASRSGPAAAAARKAKPAATLTVKDPKAKRAARMRPKLQEYWESVLDSRTRHSPELDYLEPRIKRSHPLGIESKVLRVGHGRRSSPIPHYDRFLDLKLQHPLYIVLLQVGPEYRAVGWDAMVLLDASPSLNPRDPNSGVAQAAFPVSSLLTHLRLLVEARMKVAVYNEVGAPMGGWVGDWLEGWMSVGMGGRAGGRAGLWAGGGRT